MQKVLVNGEAKSKKIIVLQIREQIIFDQMEFLKLLMPIGVQYCTLLLLKASSLSSLKTVPQA
jgi:hypothetical protein